MIHSCWRSWVQSHGLTSFSELLGARTRRGWFDFFFLDYLARRRGVGGLTRMCGLGGPTRHGWALFKKIM
jgi:hypothetical protein